MEQLKIKEIALRLGTPELRRFRLLPADVFFGLVRQ